MLRPTIHDNFAKSLFPLPCAYQSLRRLTRLVTRIYLKLMEKYQNTDPFKYILYSAKIGEQTPAMTASK
jgi:hypothetical protein